MKPGRVRRDGRRPASLRLRAAAALALLGPAASGCTLTEAELRSILASGSTSTLVATVNTAFTSIIGAAINNALGDVLRQLFGVETILK